jgi:hypothetical protein
MSAIEKLASASNIGDFSLQLQRPTSAKTPDVSHILADVFGFDLFILSLFYFCINYNCSNKNSRDLFTKDALSVNTIKNLDISSNVDDEYHKRYVKTLKDVNNNIFMDF